MGAYGVYMDKFVFSVAMPNLIQARLSDIAGASTTRGGLRYFNVMMGVKQQVGAIKIEPSIFLQKMIDAPFRVDLNLKGSFLNERVIGAVGYRAGTGGGLGVMVGTRINGLTFAYSYDYGLQRFQQYSGGAHEITIGYAIDKKKLASSEGLK
jgi:type IX secretion system PorP/SprF family membrane protein